ARRLCEKCKEAYVAPDDALSGLGWDFVHDGGAEPTLYRPTGGGTCAGAGYRGPFAIHEVMAVSEEIERLIVDRGHSEDIRQLAIAQGMLALPQAGLTQVAGGFTSLEGLLR